MRGGTRERSLLTGPSPDEGLRLFDAHMRAGTPTSEGGATRHKARHRHLAKAPMEGGVVLPRSCEGQRQYGGKRIKGSSPTLIFTVVQSSVSNMGRWGVKALTHFADWR